MASVFFFFLQCNLGRSALKAQRKSRSLHNSGKGCFPAFSCNGACARKPTRWRELRAHVLFVFRGVIFGAAQPKGGSYGPRLVNTPGATPQRANYQRVRSPNAERMGVLILSHSGSLPLATSTLLCLCSLKRQRNPDLSHPMRGREVEGSPKLRALGGTHSQLWRVGAGAEMGERDSADERAGVTRGKDRGQERRRVGGGAGDEEVAVKDGEKAGGPVETNPPLERSYLPSQLLFR